MITWSVFWQILIMMGIVLLSAFGGFFLGALFVYKTKRESHEPFIGKPSGGEVFSIDPFEEDEIPEDEDIMPNSVQKQANRFIEQLQRKVVG